MKTLKRIILLGMLLMLCACSGDENSALYRDKLRKFAFTENTYVVLANEIGKTADIGIGAGKDTALVSITYGDRQIDQYYVENGEYCYLKGFGEDQYYFVEGLTVFSDPLDIYKQMVFDPADISDVRYVETIEENGKSLAHVTGKIASRQTQFYWNIETDTLEKVIFHDDSMLSFAHREIALPSEMKDAVRTDADVINKYIEEFTASIDR